MGSLDGESESEVTAPERIPSGGNRLGSQYLGHASDVLRCGCRMHVALGAAPAEVI